MADIVNAVAGGLKFKFAVAVADVLEQGCGKHRFTEFVYENAQADKLLPGQRCEEIVCQSRN
jgi:hypothetical protein